MSPRLRWLLGLVAAFVATVPAWSPWIDPRMNLRAVDDAKNHLLRFYHLFWLMDHGVWHPRWLPDMFMGYGYPLFDFYAPGAYYVGWTLRSLLQLDVWDSFRGVGVVAALLLVGGTYSLTHAVWRRPLLGVLAAITVAYGPYVLQINLFRRADIPETLGLSLAPWLLLALWGTWLARSRPAQVGWTAAAALVGAAIVLSHNLTALVNGGLATVWTLYLLAARPGLRPLGRVVAAGVVAVGLSAFFWAPAVADGKLVHLEELWGTGGLDYKGWFIEPNGRAPRQQNPENRQTRTGLIDLNLHYPHQLIAPPKVSLAQVGLAGIATASIALAPRRAGAILPLLAVAVACWSLTFAQSDVVWRNLPPLQLLQFPWRLFGPLGICIAVAGAGALAPLLDALERRWGGRGQALGWATGAAVAAGVLVNSLGDRPIPFHAHPDRTFDAAEAYADETKDPVGVGTTTNKEFLPRDVQVAVYTVGTPRVRNAFERLFPEPDWLGGRLTPLAGDLRVLGWRAGPTWISVRVANDSPAEATLGLRQTRFPGWRAWLDGRRTAIGAVDYVPEQQAALGFMTIALPPGEHTVNLAFGPTGLRLAALAVTLATLLGGTGALLAAAWLRPALLGLIEPPRWLRPAATGAWLLLSLLCAVAVWREVRPAIGRFAVPPTPAMQQRNGVWVADDLARRGAGLIVNLAEAIRTGQGAIASPSGTALGTDKFVDVRQLTVTDADAERGWAGTSRREWLYLHPPSRVSVDVQLPAGRETWFQAALTLDPAMWDFPLGDGVRFQALVSTLQPGGVEGPATVLLERDVNPRADRGARRWIPVEADLSPWSGSTVRLILQTQPRDDQAFDWAGWANPMVVVRESARSRDPSVG